jgi:hypothetical protein
MLHEQGVKEVEIRAALYEATALYEKRRARTSGAVGAAGRHLKAVLGKPHDVTQDALTVVLTLKVDRRIRKSISVGEKSISDLAEDLINHPEADDDYIIVTKTGQKIRPYEILVRSMVLIEADGKTVNRDKAWLELKRFYDELGRTGVFEQ